MRVTIALSFIEQNGATLLVLNEKNKRFKLEFKYQTGAMAKQTLSKIREIRVREISLSSCGDPYAGVDDFYAGTSRGKTGAAANATAPTVRTIFIRSLN